MLLRRRLSLLAKAVRAPFLLASAIPVLLGAAVALANTGRFNLGLLLESLLGCVALQAGANVANDYYDWLSGADALCHPSPYNGGSQVLPSGQVTADQERRLYLILYASALLIGCHIAWQVGPTVLLIGFTGLMLGHCYTAPPVAFSYRGLGELVTGITFGPLIVSGSYLVQTGSLHWLPVLVSVPVGLLITAVLYINEFPDYLSDQAVGKLTWVVRTHAQQIWVYQWLVGGATLTALGLLAQQNPWFILAAIPLSWLAGRPLLATRRLTAAKMLPLQRGTLELHTFTGLGLTLAYLISGLR